MLPEPSAESGHKPKPESEAEPTFVTDRMLGTLTRYLRFMGYDTVSANGLLPGNAKEDTLLLEMAAQEHRILLTRDHELARRGKDHVILISSDDVMVQVQQLIDRGLVRRQCRMSRCSLCNTVLRAATGAEIAGAEYAPEEKTGLTFFWCDECSKLYWNGSHGRMLSERIGGRRDLS
ncbi:MAG: Mut7-C RNAse domain-containing protein [Methanoregula sp.]|nr:Mut7-C RNAse domain-containing protein [Methanoregula sp.]